MTTSRPSSRRVTLRDVAERVGVTPSAVSMALADSSRISTPTKEAVRAAASELGYVGSSAAKALRSQRAGAIALIVPTTSHHVFGHSYFMHVLSGVTAVANEHDVKLLIATNPDEADGLAAYERVMRSRSADGAILTSARIEDETVTRLLDSGLPVVLIGSYPHHPQAVTVSIDDRAASAMATEHLIAAHGRTRLLHLTGPLDHQTGVDRRDGFYDALARHGLTAVGDLPGDFSEASGRDLVRWLGARVADVDGIVAANDDMALGAIQELQSQGIGVPGDVAVIGFDDFGLSRVTTPSIATVHVPAEEMAATATRRLLELVEGRTAGWSHHQAEVALLPRASCGC